MISHLQHFFQDWYESFKTYYLSYMVAFIAAILWIVIIKYNSSYEHYSTLSELLSTCGIAFPLFLLGPLYNQIRNKPNYRIVVGSSIVAMILSLAFAWYVTHYGVFTQQADVQHHILVVMLSFLIAWVAIFAVVAYAYPRDNLTTRGRWKELLVNAVIAGLGSAILRGGISASLGSIDYLFDVDIDYKWYMYVGVVSFLIIGVSIFLTNLYRTEYTRTYHSFFRFFGLYIFFPLAIIYAGILFVYGLKIVGTGQRPKGLISMMVIGYTIFGLATYLLTYPLETTSVGLKRGQQAYFISILVFLPLLFGAIGMRISQYGITESRYLIVMIGLWIAIIGVTSLIWPKKSFGTMVFTLIGLAISSAYLPRGAGPIALHSQKSRLESLLEKHGYWNGTQLIVQEKDVQNMSDDEQKDISQASNVIEYLSRSFGPKSLSYLYTNSATGFQELLLEGNYWSIGDMFVRKLGITGQLPGIYDWDVLSSTRGEPFSFYKDTNELNGINISEYNYLVDVASYESYKMLDQNITLSYQGSHKEIITITIKDNPPLEINLNDFAPELYNISHSIGTSGVTMLKKDFDRYSIIFNSVSGNKIGDKYELDSYDITLLIK